MDIDKLNVAIAALQAICEQGPRNPFLDNCKLGSPIEIASKALHAINEKPGEWLSFYTNKIKGQPMVGRVAISGERLKD